MGGAFRYFRVLYNFFSFVSLVLILYVEHLFSGKILFTWDGWLLYVRIFLIIASIIILWLGAKQYNMKEFLGLNQALHGVKGQGISAEGEFNTSGILKIVRHPWYLGSIIIIWMRNLDMASIIVNSIFTIYLIVGSYIEEKKLVRFYDDKYTVYQKKVSMLFPVKWVQGKLKR